MKECAVLPVGTPRLLDTTIEVLRVGGVVVLPTETVYGFAVRADRKDAVDKLLDIKQKRLSKLAYLVSEPDDMDEYVESVPPRALLLARRFWPGPLTIVIESKGQSYGFRCPSFPFTLSVARDAGFPIYLTSANVTTLNPAISANEVINMRFSPSPDLIIDGGKAVLEKHSTVVKVSGDDVMLIRTGSLPASRIPYLEERER